VFEQLTLLAKENGPGQALARADIQALSVQLVDVIVQCALEGRRRIVKEIWWRDAG
jgi:hypothetical protein